MRTTTQILSLFLIILLTLDCVVTQNVTIPKFFKTKKIAKNTHQYSNSTTSSIISHEQYYNWTSRIQNGLININSTTSSNATTIFDKFRKYITKEVKDIAHIAISSNFFNINDLIKAAGNDSGDTLKIASKPIIKTSGNLYGFSFLEKITGNMNNIMGHPKKHNQSRPSSLDSFYSPTYSNDINNDNGILSSNH